MMLTRGADYAVRVMIHPAGLPPGSRASRAGLAAGTDAPNPFLSKVLQNLTRSGLVISHRGNTGTFELSALHRNISMLKIVEAVEGPVALNLCLTSKCGCPRQSWCPAHNVWAEAQRVMVEVLRNASIDDLAKKAAARDGSGAPAEALKWTGRGWQWRPAS